MYSFLKILIILKSNKNKCHITIDRFLKSSWELWYKIFKLYLFKQLRYIKKVLKSKIYYVQTFQIKSDFKSR